LYASCTSKQAVNQYNKRQQVFDKKVHHLILNAQDLKDEHPGCGVEKMYFSLNPKFIGRDRFIDLFMDLGFRVKRNKNYRRTTYASPVNYPNLIKGMTVDKPSTIWQSDITYIQAGDRFYYAVFIIDVYTKVIVGYQLSNHMRASANCDALKLALKHHN
jgi:putative transposase